MATIGREKLLAVAKAFGTIATTMLEEQGEGELLKYAMRFDSNSPEYVLNRIFGYSEMRKWVGERKFGDTRVEDFSIKSDKFEASMKVDRDDMQFDRLGLYDMELRNMIDSYRRKRKSAVARLLKENVKGVDGLPLFHAAHPLFDSEGRTYGNLGTEPLSGAAYDAAVEQMSLIPTHQSDSENNADEYLEVQPDTLIVGPKLRAKVRDLFGLKFIADEDGTTIENPYYGQGPANVIIENQLGTSEAWFLLDSTKPLKPFIVMDVPRPSGQRVEFNAVTDPNDSYVMINDAFLYGISARWGMAGGVWQVIYGSNLG